MKKIKYFMLFLFVILSVAYLFARDKPIILTSLAIKSLEHCSARQSVELGCRSYRQTTGYTCGPATVMALMNYYGLLSAANMNQQTELRIANEMNVTNEGVSSSQMISWLEKRGFSIESGGHISTDAIIENINHKIPTIVEFGNHWLLAKGYTKGTVPDEDEIIFSDPCCTVTTISRKTIDSSSRNDKPSNGYCASNAGGYIVAKKNY